MTTDTQVDTSGMGLNVIPVDAVAVGGEVELNTLELEVEVLATTNVVGVPVPASVPAVTALLEDTAAVSRLASLAMADMVQ